MKYCPTTHLGHATLHFHLPTCFCKLLNFGTNNFSLPSISLHTLHQTIINFPSHPIATSTHGNFATHTSWKTQFNSQSFFLCFLSECSRINFKKRVLTSIEGSLRLGDDVSEKGLDTWDLWDDEVMSTSTRPWALKKKLYLKLWGGYRRFMVKELKMSRR
jgi:hypothetical protein